MIIAIGGGEVYQNQTYDIDKFIVESSNKENPHFLFIPTASKDADAYIETISNLYESLGCKTDTLYLSNAKVNKEEVNQKIENADIIYVGGGNTAYMMQVWRKYSVDKALIKAYKSGKILSGLSAGSICWFIAGHSDSEFIEDVENPKHKWVKGLGIIPYLHCPHYDEPERVGFDEFYSGQIADAIAIENQVAVIWDNYEINVIKSNHNKNAYKLSWSDKGLSKEVLF
ncbi:peptidase E [Gardnerella sp. DNF01144]|uniref:Type 1 glutamine amidotransferase-like domain-containing protein n=1 Tax=Gardnerella TaxID=2701 RepID=UPI0002634EB9|nr:peptidase E [Gardnerella pickettii]EIK85939.1 peptidase S51 dipeptidase E [Gardnerella pickettii 00703C2mash]